MSTITTKDGTSIFYKDWGAGRPIVFSHGWPFNADTWDEQLVWFATRGFRTIAHDRRGHGRSSQPWTGHDMDTYADDLAALIERLDLRDIVLVGHSTGGGEITRYLGRHGSKRVSKLVLASAVPPLMLKTPNNPLGQPIATFDAIRNAVATNRSEFYRQVSTQFFNADRPGANVPQGLRDQFWLQCMQCGYKAALDCIAAFSETDFNADLAKIDVPTLIIHGDDDQVVPINASARLSVKRIRDARLIEYPGASHMLPILRRDRFHEDLLGFVSE